MSQEKKEAIHHSLTVRTLNQMEASDLFPDVDLGRIREVMQDDVAQKAIEAGYSQEDVDRLVRGDLTEEELEQEKDFANLLLERGLRLAQQNASYGLLGTMKKGD